jgi:hypothetical protein
MQDVAYSSNVLQAVLSMLFPAEQFCFLIPLTRRGRKKSRLDAFWVGNVATEIPPMESRAFATCATFGCSNPRRSLRPPEVF